MIVGSANFLAMSTFGAESGFSELEVKLLIPSVQRTMERMPASAAQKGAIIIDPLIIATVLIMWGKRVATIQDRKAKEKYVQEPLEQARANGISGTVHSVSTEPQYQHSADGNNGVTEPVSPSYVPEEIRRSFEDDRF